MSFRDLLPTLLVSFGLVLLLHYFDPVRYFFPKSKGGVESVSDAGAAVAPEEECVSKPLQKEVDFDDADIARLAKGRPESETEVRTNWGRLTFTTHGAALTRLGILHTASKEPEYIYTIVPPRQEERTDRCFLLAFDKKTPYLYELIERTNGDGVTRLVYEARTDMGVVRKTFAIHADRYQIDLNIEVNLRGGDVTTPRILFTAPLISGGHDVGSRTAPTGSLFAICRDDSFDKRAQDRLEGREYWVHPQIFGADQQYFTHAYVGGTGGAVERAYTHLRENKQMMGVLEGPSIGGESKSWSVSFYMGPKAIDAMTAVDSRLEKGLEYSGWFAPISYFLLRALKWLNQYVNNFGFAILLLTLLIKLLLLPMGIRADMSMRGRAEFQKKWEYVQRKYKDDKERLARERAELLKKYGTGLGGCLPLLLQFPIFIGLSRVLSNAVELYRAPFLWVPDLSAKDPWYILPFLVMISMLLQARTSPSGQQLTVVASAIVVGAMMANFSAGLVLYIAASTILGLLQTALLRKLRVIK